MSEPITTTTNSEPITTTTDIEDSQTHITINISTRPMDTLLKDLSAVSSAALAPFSAEQIAALAKSLANAESAVLLARLAASGAEQMAALAKSLANETRNFSKPLANAEENTSYTFGDTNTFHEATVQLEDRDNSLNQIKDDIIAIRDELSTFHINGSLEPSSMPIQQRYMPVKWYLSNPNEEQIKEVDTVVRSILDTIGFEIYNDPSGVRGSFLKNMTARSKELLTRRELQDRLNKVEESIQTQYLQKPKAEVDKTLAEAAARLLEATKDQETAFFWFGSMVVIKRLTSNPQVIVRTLTNDEIMFMSRHNHMIKNADDFLSILSAYNAYQPSVEQDQYDHQEYLKQAVLQPVMLQKADQS